MRLLVDLVLPPRCPGCGSEGAVLCEPCLAWLARRVDEPAGLAIGLPATMPAGLVQLEWCATYSGPVRDAIHALKYRGEKRLVEPLAAVLARRWQRAGAGGDTIAWVPVHRTRRRERGFDQAEELAAAMATQLGLPALAALERRQRTEVQHALGQADRADNLRGAFSVSEQHGDRVAERWIVLVDDIMTTGATLAAGATALLEAGALAVSAITLARDR